MQVIDLCSGIGGMSLGFEQAGFSTVAFCEVDERCQRVLAKRWPGVPIYPDVRDRDGLPLSGSVGSGQERGTVRLAELAAVRDPWIVTENVHHGWKRWVPELRRRLHWLGYSSMPLQLSAAEIGGKHQRRRVFLVAHADSERLRQLSRWWSREGGKVAHELAVAWDSAPRGLGADDGLRDWSHRRKQLGNAIVPHCAEIIARAIKEQITVTGGT